MPKRAPTPAKSAAASGARADGAGGDSALPTAAAAGVRCVNFQAHASDGKTVAAKLETPVHAGARCKRSRRMRSMHSMLAVHMPACCTAAAIICYSDTGIGTVSMVMPALQLIGTSSTIPHSFLLAAHAYRLCQQAASVSCWVMVHRGTWRLHLYELMRWGWCSRA